MRGHRAKPSRQPRDHADIEVALGDIGQPFPGIATLDGLCALIATSAMLLVLLGDCQIKANESPKDARVSLDQFAIP
jgi:hypothetical protein